MRSQYGFTTETKKSSLVKMIEEADPDRSEKALPPKNFVADERQPHKLCRKLQDMLGEGNELWCLRVPVTFDVDSLASQKLDVSKLDAGHGVSLLTFESGGRTYSVEAHATPGSMQGVGATSDASGAGAGAGAVATDAAEASGRAQQLIGFVPTGEGGGTLECLPSFSRHLAVVEKVEARALLVSTLTDCGSSRPRRRTPGGTAARWPSQTSTSGSRVDLDPPPPAVVGGTRLRR